MCYNASVIQRQQVSVKAPLPCRGQILNDFFDLSSRIGVLCGRKIFYLPISHWEVKL